MRKLRKITAWESEFTCTDCGSKTTLYHGVMTKKQALVNLPKLPRVFYNRLVGTWNGWFITGKKNKELCSNCLEKHRENQREK